MKQNNPMFCEESKTKSNNTRLQNRIDTLSGYNLLNIENGIYEFKCDNGENHNFKIDYNNFKNRRKYNTTICTKCNPINSLDSGKEISFRKLFTRYNDEIYFNIRDIIKPYELDVYIPKLKLAFEFNGIYWHSSEFKDVFYHQDKYFKCLNKDIQLFTIWENDWDNNRQYIEELVNYFVYEKNTKKSDVIFKNDKILNIIGFNINNITEIIKNYKIKNRYQIITYEVDSSYADIKFLLDLGFNMNNITEPKLLETNVYNAGNLQLII